MSTSKVLRICSSETIFKVALPLPSVESLGQVRCLFPKFLSLANEMGVATKVSTCEVMHCLGEKNILFLAKLHAFRSIGLYSRKIP